MRRGRDTYRLPTDWRPDQPGAVDQLNQILVEVKARLDSTQKIGAKAPPVPINVTVAGRQGVFWMTWGRVVGVDGYIVVVSTDAAQLKLVHRVNIPDGESCTFQLPVGNAAVTYHFSVSSYVGNQISQRSAVVAATSISFGGGESAPPAPFHDPRDPHITFREREGGLEG